MNESGQRGIAAVKEILLYSFFAIPLLSFGGVDLKAELILSLLIAFAALVFIFEGIFKGLLFVPKAKYSIPLGMFVAGLLLSTVFSIHKAASIRSVIVTIDAVFVFIFVLSLRKTRSGFQRMLFVIVSIALIAALYAIYEPVSLAEVTGSWHINGPFYNHNHFGAFICLCLFMPVILLYYKKESLSPLKRYFLMGAAVIFSSSLLLSLSRGAIVSTLIALMMTVILLGKSRRRYLVATTLFFCA